MKKKKFLSLLLCLALFCALLTPGTMVQAANDANADTGMKVNKTATYNGKDDFYTITLEAYATGEKTISTVTKDVPTDIVLVLDLSSSMKEDIGKVSYSEYSNKNNEELYALRHNGGDGNLWYQDGDSYYSVSVTAEGRTPNYTNPSSYTNSSLYSNRNNLYAKIGEKYVQVTVSRDESGCGRDKTYTYTYTYNGSTVTRTSNGKDGKPSFDTSVTLHVLSSVDTTNAVYTYTYTDSTGTHIIATSTGGTTVPTDATFYSRSTSTSGGVSRLAALKTACTNFADAVAAKCTTTDGKTVNHRIAVVGFNSSSTLKTGTSVDTALIDMSTSTGETAVKTAITGLSTSQGTVPATGLSTANDIFNANPVTEGETRNRVVVFFTDGYPSTSGADSFDRELADAAIREAETAKNTYGATVYSIAVISGADPTQAGVDPGKNLDKGTSDACNWYLHKVSSNNGTPKTPSHYLSANDAASLNNIFKQISDQIETGGSSSTLDSSAVVKDIISPQFTLPEGATADSITLKTYKYNGSSFDATNAWTENKDSMGATATVDSESGTVSVTGFNFSENWCGSETVSDKTTYRGNKLVISFKVQPKAGFLGGNDVFTNTSAGVYADSTSETPIVTFNRPTVNVPIQNVTVIAEDKNVYLLNGVTANQLKSGATVEVGSVKLDLSKATDTEKPYGLEPWQTEYVNISVKIKSGNEEITNLNTLTADKTYTVEVTVTPKTTNPTSTVGPKATTQTGSSTGKINVFKPELTFKDSEAYYGDTVPTLTGNLTKTEWKHGKTNSTGVTMTGEAPTLALTYKPDESKITGNKINTKADIEVDATVKIGSTDVTNHTSFQHTNCENQTCVLPDNKEFLIHVKTCTLEIKKTGGAADESYVFDVYKDNEKYSEVTVWGNGTETLVELPVGTYTIQENTGWSWRYTANNGGSAALTAQNPNGSITCTNRSNNKIYWLNGFSQVVRNIYGKTE